VARLRRELPTAPCGAAWTAQVDLASSAWHRRMSSSRRRRLSDSAATAMRTTAKNCSRCTAGSHSLKPTPTGTPLAPAAPAARAAERATVTVDTRPLRAPWLLMATDAPRAGGSTSPPSPDLAAVRVRRDPVRPARRCAPSDTASVERALTDRAAIVTHTRVARPRKSRTPSTTVVALRNLKPAQTCEHGGPALEAAPDTKSHDARNATPDHLLIG
jgi:hypothetical protein